MVFRRLAVTFENVYLTLIVERVSYQSRYTYKELVAKSKRRKESFCLSQICSGTRFGIWKNKDYHYTKADNSMKLSFQVGRQTHSAISYSSAPLKKSWNSQPWLLLFRSRYIMHTANYQAKDSSDSAVAVNSICTRAQMKVYFWNASVLKVLLL